MTEGAPAVVAEVDALGLKCPLPVLMARHALKTSAPRAIILVCADDPLARIDIPNFCRSEGHDLLGTEKVARGFVFRIRKAR